MSPIALPLPTEAPVRLWIVDTAQLMGPPRRDDRERVARAVSPWSGATIVPRAAFAA